MRFFANQQDRPGLFLARPDRKIEHQPAEHRDNGRSHIRRHARDVDDRDRLAARRHAENLGDEFRHGIAHQHAREHELVARIAFELIELALDPHIGRSGGRLVELAHFILQDRRQIGEQIGDRGIDGDFAEAFGKPVFHPRLEQAFGKNICIFHSVATRGSQQDFAVLFEIHQPIGHLQIGDVEDHAGAAKRRGIFAMRVDHDDMTLGRSLADAVNDQRRAGRFAGACRAEQGEMLAEHGVDVKSGTNVAGRKDRTYLDEVAAVAGIDLPQVARRRGIDQCAGDRVASYATVKAMQPPGQAFLVAFAEKVSHGKNTAGGFGILFLVAHGGEQPASANLNLDLAADLAGLHNRRIVAGSAFGEPLQVDRDLAATAANLQNYADRLVRIVHFRHLQIGRTSRSSKVPSGSRCRRLQIVPVHIRHWVCAVVHRITADCLAPED